MTVNGENITYLYDANDSRMYKNVDTTLQEYYLKDLGVLDMKTGNWTYYASGTERHLRIVPDNAHQPRLNATEPTIEFINSEFSFYETDHLGNTRVVFNPFKGDTIYAIEFAADYYPYGKILRQHVNTPEKYQLTGKQRDEERELGYFGARYYDSGLGRFLSPDPMGVKRFSWSLYNYCQANPIMRTDPNGALDGDYWTTQGDGTVKYDHSDENTGDGKVYIDGKEIPTYDQRQILKNKIDEHLKNGSTINEIGGRLYTVNEYSEKDFINHTRDVLVDAKPGYPATAETMLEDGASIDINTARYKSPEGLMVDLVTRWTWHLHPNGGFVPDGKGGYKVVTNDSIAIKNI